MFFWHISLTHRSFSDPLRRIILVCRLLNMTHRAFLKFYYRCFSHLRPFTMTKTHKQTNPQIIFFHITLPTLEGTRQMNSSYKTSNPVYSSFKKKIYCSSYDGTTHCKWIVLKKLPIDCIAYLKTKIYPSPYNGTTHDKGAVLKKLSIEYIAHFKRNFYHSSYAGTTDDRWILLVDFRSTILLTSK